MIVADPRTRPTSETTVGISVCRSMKYSNENFKVEKDERFYVNDSSCSAQYK